METLKAFSGQISISRLCLLAQVSRAGYYRWLNRKKSPKQRLDKQLMALIKAIYNERKGKWGYRRIKMELNNRLGKHYNVKRIRRLMSLLGLRAVIRRPRHTCTIVKGNNFEPNRLNRDFTANHPNQKWVIDVTYLSYGDGKRAFLSAVKDLYDNTIIAYVVSRRNDNPLVMKTIKQALMKEPQAQPLLYSDRGFQYTSKEFAHFTAKHGLVRSMSRVGRCLDNAPPQWKAFGDIIKMKHTMAKALIPLKH